MIYFVIFWLPEYLRKERHFDLAMVGEPSMGTTDAAPSDPFAGEIDEWIGDGYGELRAADELPEPGYANCAPSGWFALELDTGTAEPAGLSDGSLVEAIVGFDRVT